MRAFGAHLSEQSLQCPRGYTRVLRRALGTEEYVIRGSLQSQLLPNPASVLTLLPTSML